MVVLTSTTGFPSLKVSLSFHPLSHHHHYHLYVSFLILTGRLDAYDCGLGCSLSLSLPPSVTYLHHYHHLLYVSLYSIIMRLDRARCGSLLKIGCSSWRRTPAQGIGTPHLNTSLSGLEALPRSTTTPLSVTLSSSLILVALPQLVCLVWTASEWREREWHVLLSVLQLTFKGHLL